MEFEHIDTVEAEYEPDDKFEPHMPGVDVLSDMDGFFEMARSLSDAEGYEKKLQDIETAKFVHKDSSLERPPVGQRYVVFVTPGRAIMPLPAAKPNSVSKEKLKPMRDILQTDRPLKITAISYTRLDAYLEDKTKTKCVPFLGFLLAFAYLGHDVLLFEGHPTALQAGVKESDFVLLDSAMLPFMQDDWAEVIFNSLNPNGRVRIHDREGYRLKTIVQQKSPPGWRETEPDGIASYVNMLLTTISKSGDRERTVVISSGQPVPNLLDLNNDPNEVDRYSHLPYRYEMLNTDEVIDLLINFSTKSKGFSQTFTQKLASTWTFTALLALAGGRQKNTTHQFRLASKKKGQRRLEIKLLS